MAAKSTRALVDRLIPGGFDAWCSRLRADNKSYEDIAFALRSEFDVSITAETVRVWANSPVEATAS